MKHLFLLIAVVFSFTSYAQTKQQRTVESFNGISAATGIEVEITQGEAESVSVSSTDDTKINNIKTVVKNGILKIYYEVPGMKYGNQGRVKLKAFVTYKDISELSASSGSTVNTINTINSNNLKVDISSGAQINAAVKVNKLALEASSGSVVKLDGSATNSTFEANSGSSISAKNFATENAEIQTSSGAIVKLTVSKSLNARASSGGSVRYDGNPEVNKKTSSGGSVSKM